MAINKERSKKIKKLLSLSLAFEMMLSMSSIAKADKNEYVEEQKRYHQQQEELQERINNLPESMFDTEYNDYCDNGVLTINGIDYVIKYLHIEYGYIGEEKKVYLKDYHNPRVDIITGESIPKDYKRVKIMDLKFSDVFYDYYHDTDEDKKLEDYINSFIGNINYMVPETYFYNPLNNGGKRR